MAFEELQQLLSKRETTAAKLDEVMSLVMLATADMLASGELTPGDPEWKAIAARAEEFGVEMVGNAAASAEMATRKAAEFAAAPGGEAIAEAHRRMAVHAVVLRARAEEFAVFMGCVGALTTDSDLDRPAVRRSRRPNSRYFGPEWSN